MPDADPDAAAAVREALRSGPRAAWGTIHVRAIEALEELIARAEQKTEFTVVTGQPVLIPERLLLYVTTTRRPPAGGWAGQAFYVLDPETVHARQPRRCPVELAYPPKAHRLVVRVTEEVRARLGTATRVHLAGASGAGLVVGLGRAGRRARRGFE